MKQFRVKSNPTVPSAACLEVLNAIPGLPRLSLIIHGDDDQIVPIGASAMLFPKLVKNATAFPSSILRTMKTVAKIVLGEMATE